MTSRRKLAVAFAVVRGLYGVALVAVPQRLGPSWLGPDAERAPVRVALRALGARDVALSIGTILAAGDGSSPRPWLLGSLGCDLTDLGATLLAGRALPERSRLGTIALAGGSAVGAAALAAVDDR